MIEFGRRGTDLFLKMKLELKNSKRTNKGEVHKLEKRHGGDT
jgi:hypothetical protein